MEILQKCKDWLETEPDLEGLKTKLSSVEVSLSYRLAVCDLLDMWLSQLDASIENPEIEITLFSDEVKTDVQKWLGWLTRDNPDYDIVKSKHLEVTKQVEEFQAVSELLIESMGEDYVTTSLESNPSASNKLGDAGATHFGTSSLCDGGNDNSYSLVSEADGSIPEFNNAQEKLAAFQALKKIHGSANIAANSNAGG